MAALGDLYVNDAFSAAHRAHVSTEGLAHKLPAFAGRAMEPELDALQKALGQPEHPVAAVVGGAQVSPNLDELRLMVSKVDRTEESRVGKECVSTCRDRWSTYK